MENKSELCGMADYPTSVEGMLDDSAYDQAVKNLQTFGSMDDVTVSKSQAPASTNDKKKKGDTESQSASMTSAYIKSNLPGLLRDPDYKNPNSVKRFHEASDWAVKDLDMDSCTTTDAPKCSDDWVKCKNGKLDDYVNMDIYNFNDSQKAEFRGRLQQIPAIKDACQ